MNEAVVTNPGADRQVAAVRSYYELVDSQDVAGLVELFTDDALYHRPGYAPLRGRAELLDFYSSGRVIDTGRHTLQSVVSHADQVAVRGEFNGVLRDGRAVTTGFADFFVLDGSGRISRRDTYFAVPMI